MTISSRLQDSYKMFIIQFMLLSNLVKQLSESGMHVWSDKYSLLSVPFASADCSGIGAVASV